MEQKVIISDSQYDVQNHLDKGWRVVNVVAQYVSIGGGNCTTNNGKFCFILERVGE
jgi:hypothetical protein